MKKPEAILFDFGDTVLHELYYRPDKGNEFLFSIAENPRNITFKDLIEYADKIFPVINEKRKSSLLEQSWNTFSNLLHDACGLRFPENANIELEFWKHALKLELAPGIIEVLDLIKLKGIRASMISNNIFSGKTIGWELEKYGLNGYFEFVMSSADYGIRKPHPLIFQTAAAMMDLDISDVWYAGNSMESDVIGSRNAGMIPVYYTGNNKKKDRADVLTVDRWQDFACILERL